MADSFAELGLDARLVEAARAAGYDSATPLQASSFAVLRRGGNVVLHASSGAGVTAAYGLPLLERMLESGAGESGPRALVVAPTTERVVRIAAALAQLANGTDMAVRARAAGWRTSDARVLVTTPAQALGDLQTSALKLEDVQVWVVTDASELFALEQQQTLETLAAQIPRDAQRVISTAQMTDDVERLIEAHARRAITLPPRAADPMPASKAAAGQIGYLVVAEAEKAELLARLLDGVSDAVVYARSGARAAAVHAALAVRGMAEPGVRAVPFDRTAPPSERVISYDVPFSADDLKRIHAQGGTVLVEPAALAHLKRIAAEASFTMKHRRARDMDTGELDAFRGAVRSALEAEDLGAQLLILEPLFDDHSPAEVAAALSALVRRRTPAAAVASGSSAPSPAVGAAPKDATTSALTRLFISIGIRDNVRAGDLVGAITGEAGIRGEQVGRVDIRDSFSVVEVASGVADRVIRALNGTTMRGRSLRVDYDRKGAAGEAGAGRGARGARGGGPRAGAGPRPGAGPRKPRRE
ncbi:MAG TPA: DbpA RNA binding domain-containing protein [Longimicrobiales bacterium]|nr:DbpA RNA binding domain-containing protein [Longimicrobiales bacterium]